MKGLKIVRLPFMMKPTDSEEETEFSGTSEHSHLLKTNLLKSKQNTAGVEILPVKDTVGNN